MLGIGPHSSFFRFLIFYFLSTSHDIGWQEHFLNDLFCVECDVKP